MNNELFCQVIKQQTIISQASQALNLCCSTIEFSGSTEQLEAEKLLLLASTCPLRSQYHTPAKGRPQSSFNLVFVLVICLYFY